MADLRKYITADRLALDAKLQLIRDRGFNKRGRDLTDAEREANFMYAVTHCDECDTHVGFAEYCHMCGRHLG